MDAKEAYASTKQMTTATTQNDFVSVKTFIQSHAVNSVSKQQNLQDLENLKNIDNYELKYSTHQQKFSN